MPRSIYRCLVTHFSVEVVYKASHEVALNVVLVGESGEVVGELIVGSDDGTMTRLVELGSAGTAEYL